MTIEVKVPSLPESVTDGTLVNWKKKPGDTVKRGENLVDLETDKVVLDIPAPADGVLSQIVRQEGEVVTTGEVIGTLEESAGSEAMPPATPPVAAASTPSPTAPATEVDLEGLSPAVRRLAAEHGLDMSKVPGSGRGGRVTKADVLAFLEGRQQAKPVSAPIPVMAASAAPRPAPVVAPAGAPLPPDSLGRLEQRVPMTRLRARIAERLLMAKNSTAMLTTFNEINMKPVMDLRNRYKDDFEKKHGVRLGFMGFFVKAVVEALKRYPAVNGSIDGNDIIYHGYYDIGIAVSSPRGLVVPILRDVDRMSLADIEKAIGEFGQKAKDGTLTVEEMTGGTFTITNGGVFGSLMSTPILNPPQSGILGMHATKDRPVAENGQVVIRPMMYVAHSYDHRIIDGREAVTFLVTVKECIEDPARLILNV
ncbi:dihydrolipoyltranssuccinate transferase,component of the 2-oxoglutarate dehydrogenase complex [Candidatus Competibacter denitrificans Run_A_D11]|uniref:Dihydrolipoyllysine-residue succinyltransferase component of 2-oxoglutarate dehydrogenase complex n=1 Tax=Candidatus Competibacter denitrificans Run_A_D11 TaxID=1400863 RepID=W6MAL6_9GAMM|nr:2-oxoglutarate dehydrogenase complex dihydrolipoyllysine-residue succinyltransferase [Candidatus Competibacter denitrificans]CDI03804.1 dihydrolipoyltranssuccinate transferase,component of the 2-oxoglutarate dehydrogenase complex [Candidatus Competibacter denitrificans Run_A_D11]HAS86052.1 2-oxoglutarate dehydrogenase complex dihydrolipoyllysine-residue succinyltransferase [Candidatus Competibacteraceae bacterium]HRC68819.1 2-oxoglutarate dehydrogenase complex dihydrolipoyllysine-residue succ